MSLDKSGKIKLFQQATGWSTDKMRANAKVVNAICEGGADNAITYDEQDLTEEQKTQARENIGATAPEVFWAEYGVTTAQEIEDAINSVKIVKAIYSNVVVEYNNKDANAIRFVSLSSPTMKGLRVTLTRSNNIWSAELFEYEYRSNKSNDIETDRNSNTKYPSVKAVADALGKWGVISQTQTWTGDNNTGYDYTMSDLVYGLIPKANIDLYVAAGAVFNENTYYFELNGLTDISYNEMTEIYNHYSPLNMMSLYQQYVSLRTVLPNSGRYIQANYNDMFSDCLSLEVTPRDKYAFYANGGTYNMFARCSKLKKISNTIYNSTNLNSTFIGCSSLESVFITRLTSNLSFADCPRLTLNSVVDAVNNAVNTNTITITLHPTAFARCQADTTQYTYEEQTYTGIIALAAAKNITIQSA